MDVTLLTTATVPPCPLRERTLFEDEIVFVVAASHPLAQKLRLTPADLVAHRLLTARTPEAENRWFLARVFGRRRPALTIERLPLTEAIVEVARSGDGIAVMSEWIASSYLVMGAGSRASSSRGRCGGLGAWLGAAMPKRWRSGCTAYSGEPHRD